MHDWNVSAEEAIELQRTLRPLVRHQGIRFEDIHSIAGVDASYREYGRAAIVVLTFPELEVRETAVAYQQQVFPYVPGLLSFREIPVVLEAMKKLRSVPDLLMVDGHGYAHPRRLGIASHLGVYLDMPSIGCAKSRLVGTYQQPGPEPGDRSPLTDHGELIGAVLRSRVRSNPLFISTGHKIDLEAAVSVVLHCLRGRRLPEPTRLADKLAGEPGAVSAAGFVRQPGDPPSLFDQPLE